MRRTALLTGSALLTLAVTACGADDGASSGQQVAVTATDSACKVAESSLPAGVHTFTVANEGSKVTEMYVYGDGDRIVTERENIGPGTTVEVTVELSEGDYEIACKPGQTGDGIRSALEITGAAGAAPKADPRATAAVQSYRTYVGAQVETTLARTRELSAAITAGDVDRAKSLYAPSRYGWESIEPVAESFGDIDPKVDLREADLEPGQTWTGWHRIEKALWAQGSTRGMQTYADQLIVDLQTLQDRIPTAEITPTSMANGAKELLDEVATGKITGEEEIFSHTDLVDFAANVEGAEKVLRLLEPVAADNEAELVGRLDAAFERLNTLLATYETAHGYVSYDTVSPPERKALSDAVNALAEPLSHLAAAVVAG